VITTPIFYKRCANSNNVHGNDKRKNFDLLIFIIIIPSYSDGFDYCNPREDSAPAANAAVSIHSTPAWRQCSLMDAFPKRPRYMHRKTCEKLRRKSVAAEQRALSVIAGGLSRNLSRLRFLAANVG
jgi:hypothetical protein